MLPPVAGSLLGRSPEWTLGSTSAGRGKTKKNSSAATTQVVNSHARIALDFIPYKQLEQLPVACALSELVESVNVFDPPHRMRSNEVSEPEPGAPTTGGGKTHSGEPGGRRTQKFMLVPIGRSQARVTAASQASAMQSGEVPVHSPDATSTVTLTMLRPLVVVCEPEMPMQPAHTAACAAPAGVRPTQCRQR